MSFAENGGVKKLVASIIASYEENPELVKLDNTDQINKEVIIHVLERLRSLVFAGYFAKKPLKANFLEFYVGELLEDLIYNLQRQITQALYHKEGPYDGVRERSERITHAFLEKIPAIRRLMMTDVEAAYDGDPAAFNRDEIILSYPGVYAIMVNRLAHELYLLEVPLIPRMMTESAHGLTGIDIHPGASIGRYFFIDHGTGIVIGETTVIGDYVKIYQGVTLGALSTRGGRLLDGVKRHPTIEDHVTIYSGASILGGSTVIGEGVVIGSNAFITKSVPERTKVSVKNTDLQYMPDGKPASHEALQEEFWDYVI
ncbi:MAG: serine acetyltransferase [Deltaproteobacteria bacterium]|jgi:serine O-acetyltransferase|nr:serine acetyltransferase [Deltaproteobacteria bacterium]